MTKIVILVADMPLFLSVAFAFAFGSHFYSFRAIKCKNVDMIECLNWLIFIYLSIFNLYLIRNYLLDTGLI